MATIGFIGLGNMGGPMALNLVKAGHQVKAYDLFPAAVQTLVDAGAEGVASAAEAAREVDYLITMLPADQHVKSLYLGDGNQAGLLDIVTKDCLLIDCSTISAEAARLVEDEAHKKGLEMVDAPVSGGTAGAQAGTLTFIVGGSESAFERAEPVLANMGKNLFHAGPAGAGQVAKACNNMLLAVSMAATSEVLNMGIRSGLDAKVLSDIMAKSSGSNWVLNVYNPVPGVMESPASRDYQPGFMAGLMAKDLGLAQKICDDSETANPMGALAKSQFDKWVAEGHDKQDFSSIYVGYRDGALD